MSYTDEATVEAYLNRDLTANEQTILPLMLAFIDRRIEDMAGGSYGSVTESSKDYDGGYASIPIDSCRNVSKVEIVGSDGIVTYEYDLGEEVILRPTNSTLKTWLDKRYGLFGRYKDYVRVTAEFSLSETVPDEIKFLATYMAGTTFELVATKGLKAETIEGYSRTFGDYDWSNDPIILEYYGAIFERDIFL